MSERSSATVVAPPLLTTMTAPGLWWGLAGVVAFSFTFPMTRVAVDGLSPLFIGAGRAVVAAALAALALALTQQRRPSRQQWLRLGVVGGGVVIGFPLLSTFALATAPAAHGAVVIAILPAATAVTAVLRGHEHPPVAFWVAAAAGALAALAFGSAQSGGFGHLQRADLLLFAAVVVAAIGYAEGGLLSRELGSWQTVSWALLLCAPLMVALTVAAAVVQPPAASPGEWAAFAYLGVFSMFLGFVAWYRGLAIGPMAQVSQVQLLQPLMSIAWAGLFLGEVITWTTVVGGLVIIGCAGSAVRVRVASTAPRG